MGNCKSKKTDSNYLRYNSTIEKNDGVIEEFVSFDYGGTNYRINVNNSLPTSERLFIDGEKYELTFPTDAPPFNLNGTRRVYCSKVYDGDTITVVVNIFNTFHSFKVRIEGIDCPEMKPLKKDYEPGELEKVKAKAVFVRDYVAKLIVGKMIFINISGFDKYGRLLASVSCEVGGKECDLAKHLLSKKMAYEYDGGTKRLTKLDKDGELI